MMAETFVLSASLDNMIVKPVEKMLATVQSMARLLKTVVPEGVLDSGQRTARKKSTKGSSKIGSKFTKTLTGISDVTQTLGTDDIDDECREGLSEANLLQAVFKKLLNLVTDFYKKGMVDLEQIESMNHESKGVILEMMMLDRGHHYYDQNIVAPSVCVGQEVTITLEDISEADINSMDLKVLELSSVQHSMVIRWILFESEIGKVTGRAWINLRTFELFLENISQQYNSSNPYHNYAHACDVVAMVYRWFRLNRAKDWLSDIDMLAMLISAVAHDVAHPGRTAQFLMETQHELAIRYNDESPLENMHCSTLFQTTKKEAYAIFKDITGPAYKALRKTCVNAIIHTDNAKHFEMVKELQTKYNLFGSICDGQANQNGNFLESYKETVLQSKDHISVWQQLILHLNDVSTPLKPWHISRAWATRVQDEFFDQGDQEKKLGIPVGFLNDRDKVVRTNSEHGFITFLVAPLTLEATKIFPLMQPLAEALVDNAQNWRDLWVDETKPTQEDIQKKDKDITKLRDDVNALAHRTTIVPGK